MASHEQRFSPAKAWFCHFAALGAVILLNASPARAYEPPAEFDKRITAELEAVNPEAAGIFRQAGQAREKGDHRSAAEEGRDREVAGDCI